MLSGWFTSVSLSHSLAQSSNLELQCTPPPPPPPLLSSHLSPLSSLSLSLSLSSLSLSLSQSPLSLSPLSLSPVSVLWHVLLYSFVECFTLCIGGPKWTIGGSALESDVGGNNTTNRGKQDLLNRHWLISLNSSNTINDQKRFSCVWISKWNAYCTCKWWSIIKNCKKQNYYFNINVYKTKFYHIICLM